jgi:hypothetical protein
VRTEDAVNPDIPSRTFSFPGDSPESRKVYLPGNIKLFSDFSESNKISKED